MNVDNDLFKKCIIDYDKLLNYGFVKDNDKYIINKKIMNDTMEIRVQINSRGVVSSKVYDLADNEEYTNYLIEKANGEFSSQVRENLENFLIDIRDNCTINNYFMSPQANRLVNLINKKYNDKPEFMWSKFPQYGVFRTSQRQKWYAIIMNINKAKIAECNEEVEILNIKLDDMVKDLLKRKGFYPAYHMNKDNWLTIILDDTISDDEIMHYIEISHQSVEQASEWLVPANPKYYDVINCFNDKTTIRWKQPKNISVGDYVYIYVGEPYSSILYKCEVIKINIPYEYHDHHLSMSKVMDLKLLVKYENGQYDLSYLKKYGVKIVRGPRIMSPELSTNINKKKGV